MRFLLVLLVAHLAVGSGRAQQPAPAAPGAQPLAARVAALNGEVAAAGWPAAAAHLRAEALDLYARQSPQAAAWYGLYRWADLLGESEAHAVARWADAINRAKAGHANMTTEPLARPNLLAEFMPPELGAYALNSPEFTAEFFSVFSQYDQPSLTLATLAALWQRNPADFKDYANLAIAIAVVYDVPPPPDWPHGQVSAQSLERKLLPPTEVFNYFVRADRTGDTLLRLRRVSAADLRFLVDTSANLDELAWARRNFRTPPAQLADVGGQVPGVPDRMREGAGPWPLPTYRLPEILKTGGIAIDRAYFAAMVGKSRGVPTMIFRGAGLDGRHAWLGFLDAEGRWQLDAGRGGEEKLMTGYAFDPQTWTTLPAHEIEFLREGFRRLPAFKTSLLHFQFAELFFYAGDYAGAVKAARAAVKAESRHLEAWNLLLAAQQRVAPGRDVESILHDAAVAFQRYPELNASFANRLAQSYRARGQIAAAAALERTAAPKSAPSDEETRIQMAQQEMLKSMESDTVQNQVRVFFRVVSQYGRGAGLSFFDQIVAPFADSLLRNNQAALAAQSIGHARRTLTVPPHSLLDAKLAELAARAEAASP